LVRASFLPRLALAASLFALCVIALGAFTRLMDAGLGCPDWPGCYGHLTAPLSGNVQPDFPESHVVVSKAWAEMVHRYFVGGLSFFILSIVITIFANPILRNKNNIILAVSLILVTMYQILLGQWTVTLQLLPVVVTQHLLGGFTIVALLWMVYLNNNAALKARVETINTGFLLPIAWIACAVLILQIMLGAWTSTNYASFSCPDFPLCDNDNGMSWYFQAAFNLFSPVGINYDGGILPEFIRQTIQMAHRFGALAVTLVMFGMTVYAMPKLKNSLELMKSIYLILGLLCVQLCLGITNVIFKLPLVTAIGHTLFAAILLLAMLTFIYKLILSKRKAGWV
jgi:cytochrome c oxidase assembly protein subunit 15